MAYTLEVNHPDLPKGTEIDCDGILVKNGSSRELTAEDELAFLGRVGKPVKDVYGHGKLAKLSGSTELDTKAEKEKAAALTKDGGEK